MTLAARKKPKRRPSRRRPTTPIVDIVVTSALWKGQRNAKTVLRRSIAAAACAVSTTEGELAIVLTDDSAMRALNRDWRRKDAATNVLSFPAENPVKKPPKKPGKKSTKNPKALFTQLPYSNRAMISGISNSLLCATART